MVHLAHAYASSIGYTVEHVDLRQFGREAMCHNPSRTIYVHPGMHHRKERSLTWHELGHATLEHEPSIFEAINRRQERQADEWAAHMLIDHVEYMLAVEKYGTNTEWIAQDLGVLEKLLTAYVRTLHRVGDVVYVNPKMGAGQWDRRLEAVC